jgi:hypothetical protein
MSNKPRRSDALRPRRLYIRPREVLTFKQERLTFGFCQCVGEAISKFNFAGWPLVFPKS